MEDRYRHLDKLGVVKQVLYKNESIKKFGFYFSAFLAGKPMEATDGEIGKCEDVLFYGKRGHIAYLVVEAFSLASENIQTSLDAAILENAPEAPREEEFSNSELEESIRNYYRLS